ncbi:phosphopantetheine-binding protein [Pseudomonas sp. NPDC007930]|uniref:phosphopantetheine-binding protein n=1 Tax=Pseudomonas sp. NPDC007930 TaxID=3364417 RepID=UPI0036E69CBC
MDTLALKKELAALLELPEAQLDNDLALLALENWDSLTKVSLLGVLSDQFGFTVKPEVLDEAHTLGELLAALAAERPALA